MTDDVTLLLGDCLDRMAEVADGSVDAIITDPPYPEIDRPYGRMTEADWHRMMFGVVAHSRRVLKPTGSAVFILQPNSEKVGRMRPWLWEFMAWTTREWNMVQDAYWWNIDALPTVHCHRVRGLMRPSMKMAVWLGAPDCYRDQDSVLWEASLTTKAADLTDRALRYSPGNKGMRPGRAYATAIERGGSTPFNVLPMSGHSETHGHGAATPEPLCHWWTRYISREGGTVCDPFMGSGTTGLAALKRGRKFIGIERDPGYFEIARARIAAHRAETPLLKGVAS